MPACKCCWLKATSLTLCRRTSVSSNNNWSAQQALSGQRSCKIGRIPNWLSKSSQPIIMITALFFFLLLFSLSSVARTEQTRTVAQCLVRCAGNPAKAARIGLPFETGWRNCFHSSKSSSEQTTGVGAYAQHCERYTFRVHLSVTKGLIVWKHKYSSKIIKTMIEFRPWFLTPSQS